MNATTNTSKKPVARGDATSRLAIDWTAGHGPLSGAAAVGSTSAAVASLGTWGHMPAPWALALGGAGVLSSCVTGVKSIRKGRATGMSLAARALGWTVGGCWTAGVLASDPYSWGRNEWWTAAVALVGGVMAVAATAHEAELHQEAADVDRAKRKAWMAGRERTEEAQFWCALLLEVANVEVKPIGLQRRADGSGFELEVQLPRGYPSARLSTHLVALQEAARLPHGCMVRLTRAERQGSVILDIDTEDTSRTERWYPDDFSPLSILTGIPWMVQRNGELVEVHLRENDVLVLGPPGSAKTTLLDGLLAGFNRCTDVLVWGIDLGKEGNAFRPWASAWLESRGQLETLPGTTPAPAGVLPGVDWIAATPEEALRMLKAAETIAKVRLSAYSGLMRLNDTMLLPVSWEIPQIMVVVDEGAELLSYSGKDSLLLELKELLLQNKRTTRAMGIRHVLTCVDGNTTALGTTEIRKGSPVRVALTSTDPDFAGVNKLFTGAELRGMDATQLRNPGAGVAGATGVGGFAAIPISTLRTKPSLARDAAIATSARRPRLDAPSARSVGDVYGGRWDDGRISWLLAGLPPRSASTASVTVPGATHTAAVPGADEDLGALLADLSGTDIVPPDWSEREGYPAAPSAPAAPAPSEPGRPEWIEAAVNLLREAGTAGIKPGPLATAVGKDRRTLHKNLEPLLASGELVYVENGPNSKYIHADYAPGGSP